jgi:hypothetical protein
MDGGDRMTLDNDVLARNSLERYRRAAENERDILSDQILDTVDSKLKQVLYEWLAVYSEEPDSKVYKQLLELSNKSCLFDV